MTTYLINGIIVFLAFSLSLLLKSYFPKYFETKATNQATKEDIGEITRIIEKVKTDLSNQTEELKSTLIRKNEHLIGLTANERQAILDYNTSVWKEIHFITNTSFTQYNDENYLEMKSLFIQLEQLCYQREISYSTLSFFYDDQKLTALVYGMNMSILELQKQFKIYITKYSSNLEHLSIQKKGAQFTIEALEKSGEQLIDYMNEFSRSLQDIYPKILGDFKRIKELLLQRLLELA